MIYDSSKDYIGGFILMLFDGETPSDNEIREYVKKNYGDDIDEIGEIDPVSEFHGLKNAGTIHVRIKQATS